MDIKEYHQIRQQLIELHRELTYHPIKMFIPQSAMLSNEEIKNFEVRSMEDTFLLGDPLHEVGLKLITVPVLSDIIQRNPDRLRSFGFHNSRDCIRLYQSISKYLNLWMDIADRARDVYLPPIAELYELEDVLLWTFHSYSEFILSQMAIKESKMKKVVLPDDENPFLALARLGVTAFRQVNTEDIKYISILDERLPNHLKPTSMSSVKKNTSNPDGAWELEFSKIANLIN